jgi:hypothetical protein
LPDINDLPFGHNTVQIRALFMPDGVEVSPADTTRAVGLHPVMIRAVWVPEGGALPGYPYEHIGSAVFIPDSDDDEERTDATWRASPPSEAATGERRPLMPSAPKTDLGFLVPAATGSGDPERSFDMRQNRLSGALPLNYASQKAIMRSGTGADLTPAAERHPAGYLQPDANLAIQAWNAMSDLRTTLAALNATSARGFPASVQNYRLIGSDTAGWIGRGGIAAAKQGRSLDTPADKDERIQVAGTTDPVIAAADLISDELSGGHTIERHVAKAQTYLESRLGRNLRLKAASAYHDLAEATAVTQQVLDANRGAVQSWGANLGAGDRLVISISRPVGSRRYVPIGSVLSRGSSSPVPADGATVILKRDSANSRGFTVITSYPTLSGSGVED